MSRFHERSVHVRLGRPYAHDFFFVVASGKHTAIARKLQII